MLSYPCSKLVYVLPRNKALVYVLPRNKALVNVLPRNKALFGYANKDYAFLQTAYCKWLHIVMHMPSILEKNAVYRLVLVEKCIPSLHVAIYLGEQG